MSDRTKAELQAEVEALRTRLAAAEDMLRAVRQVSASPLPSSTYGETTLDRIMSVTGAMSQLHYRLARVQFWTGSFLDGSPWAASCLRKTAAEEPFTYPPNPVWALKYAGIAPEDFEREAS